MHLYSFASLFRWSESWESIREHGEGRFWIIKVMKDALLYPKFDQDIHCVGTTITWQLVFVSFAFFGNVITHAQLCARKINKYIHIFGNQSTLTAHYSESRSTWLVAHVSEKSPIFRGITSNLHSRFFSDPTRWTAKA